jgi:hypothetical protein
MSKLPNRNLNIELLAIQETWAIQHPDLLTITGLQLITKTRTNSRVVVVRFYIKNISNKSFDNLSCFNEKHLKH